MRRLLKSKRVSWASNGNLCQVKLFLSEEPPAQVGLGAQDHLQAKASWLPHSPGSSPSDDILPPGFEASHHPNQSQIKASEIPVIKWRCPPRFGLNFMWQVVVGEESKEVEVQNQREMRVLEAVYPRPSAIPTNPTFPIDTMQSEYSDHQIPLVPITPIEDEDYVEYTPSGPMGPANVPISSQPHVIAPMNERPAAGLPLGIEPNIVAAASAALGSINKANDIDPELLIKILSNPKLIEKLVTDYGASSSAQNGAPSVQTAAASSMQNAVSSTCAPPPSVNSLDQSHMHMHGVESSYAQQNGVDLGLRYNSRPPPFTASNEVKDVNYYKNLIHQHGTERQEPVQQFNGRQSLPVRGNQEFVNHKPRDRELKPKIMKPCSYFNTPRGCKLGGNCQYQHDEASSHQGDMQRAKRMKMDREISS